MDMDTSKYAGCLIMEGCYLGLREKEDNDKCATPLNKLYTLEPGRPLEY